MTRGKLTDDSIMLQDKLKDLENRSCRANICFRGVLEHITNLQAPTTALLKDLTREIPDERLELEREHRALMRRLKDGPPQDIIVKISILSHKGGSHGSGTS